MTPALPDGDADGFAVFGHVVEGMDVVKRDPRRAYVSNGGRGRDEGPDARPADQDHQSGAREVAGRTRGQRLLQHSGRGRTYHGE